MEEAKSSRETDLFNTGLNCVNHSCLKVFVGGEGGYKYLISMNKKHKINGTTDLLVYLAEGRNLKLESLGKINQRNPKISKAFMRKQKYIPVPRFVEKILIISL